MTGPGLAPRRSGTAPSPPRRPVLRRLALCSGVLAAVAALVCAVAVHVAAARYGAPAELPTGRLTVDAGAAGTSRLGPFTVALTADGLDVRGPDGHDVWQSPPGGAFLAALRGGTRWHDRTGMFTSGEALRGRLVDQTVTGRRAGPGELVLRGRLSGSGAAASYVVDLRADGPQRLRIRLHVDGVDATVLRLGATPGEAVHGLGEQFTAFDLRGRFVPVVAREQGIGRGRQPITTLAELAAGQGGDATSTYTAIPFFATSALRALAVDTYDYVAVDLRPADRFDVTTWSPDVTATLYRGASPAGLLAAHTADTGRMRVLPAWTRDGAIVAVQGGTAAVLREVDRLTAAGARLSGVWLEDWTGRRTTSFGTRAWWDWRLDPAWFPHWQQLVAGLHARGIRVLTYVNPMLVPRPGTPGDLYAAARARGYLVTHADGSPYLVDEGDFRAAMVDLSNPAAVAWFRDVIARQVAGIGADGWMADYGEDLPYDAHLAGGSPADWHDRWPDAWAALNHAACVAAGKPDCVYFMRTAGLHTAGIAPLFWAGDQTVTWDAQDGLRSAVHGVLAAGVSGMTLDHTDVGGYTTLVEPLVGFRRGPELLDRWAELAAWGPVMRTHEGNLPDRNAQVWDPAVLPHFVRATQVYAALAPYRAVVERQTAAQGLPAWRHTWLVAPGSPAAGDDDQFFFGGDFLVAPVMTPGARSVSAYLPAGRWVHLWTGRVYGDPRAATRVTVAAPIGEPGVFYRVGDPWGPRVRAALGLG